MCVKKRNALKKRHFYLFVEKYFIANFAVEKGGAVLWAFMTEMSVRVIFR